MTSGMPRNQHQYTALLMLGAVLLFSAIPLVIYRANGSANPFYFSGLWKVGLVAGHLTIFAGLYWRLLLSKSLFPMARRLFCFPFLIVVLGNFDLAFFAWATRYVDTLTVTMIFETQPLLVVFMFGWIFRKEGRFAKATWMLYFLAPASFIGALLVLTSYTGNLLETLEALSFDKASTYAGILLAIFSSVSGAVGSVFGVKLGVNLSRDLPAAVMSGHGLLSTEISLTTLVLLLSHLISTPISFVFGYLQHESIDAGMVLPSLIVGGMILSNFGIMCWRASSLMSRTTGIQSLVYLRVIFSVILLYLFAGLSIASSSFLIVGAIVIASANVMIYRLIKP